MQCVHEILDGMEYLQLNTISPQAAALLAIHSAISYADALRYGLGDDRLSSGSHGDAAGTLRKLCVAKGLPDLTGIAHLEYLLSKKTPVSYGSQRIPEGQIDVMLLRAERFARWAVTTSHKMMIEGEIR